MKKIKGKKRRNKGYADKVKARRRLASKHGLDPNLPYPVLWTLLERMGVNIDN